MTIRKYLKLLDNKNRIKYDQLYKLVSMNMSAEIYLFREKTLIHVTVPSSTTTQIYDVVIEVKTGYTLNSQKTIEDLDFTSFSNSPDFIYKHAAEHYANHALWSWATTHKGIVIAANTPNRPISMDKTIYFAIKYLQDNDKLSIPRIKTIIQKIHRIENFLINIRSVSQMEKEKFNNLPTSVRNKVAPIKVDAKAPSNINSSKKPKSSSKDIKTVDDTKSAKKIGSVKGQRSSNRIKRVKKM